MENFSTQGFSFDLPKGNSSIIKVIGVGGGGNNALKYMYEKGIHGVDFVVCNTDAQTLDNNPVSSKVQLGVSITEGLGAGADPEVGEKSAIESIDEIKASLGQNTKMVFITAGMGGGTGTGAAPVIAKIAKEMGILTVGIVTIPFSFEGKRRLDQAEIGLEKLRNNVDSLIVINNDKLRHQFGNLGFKQGFSKADEVLYNAAKGMAEVITGYFTINIDFRDAKSVLANSGTALMSAGVATGENKAEEAVKKALDSPLLNDNKITGAKNVLLLIRSGNEEATMDEVGIINDYIQKEAGNTADIIFGVGADEELGDAISVLVIATGFAKDDKKNTGTSETIKIKLNDVPERRESPFKTNIKSDREEIKTNISDNKNLFLLDDKEEGNVLFQVKEVETITENTAPETNWTENEEKLVKFNYNEDEKTQELDLFTYEEELDDDNDLQAQSFTFETEEQTPKVETNTEKTSDTTFTEEKPISFSFFVNEPINETLADFSEPVEKIINEPVQNFEIPKAENLPQNEFASKTLETNIETTLEIEESKIEIQKEFTFISKPNHDNKVLERRNKLKEFNSRYQVSDSDEDFEKTPAFKRKNIAIDDMNVSEQKISSFLSENNNGKMEVRENKFLNKDTD